MAIRSLEQVMTWRMANQIEILPPPLPSYAWYRSLVCMTASSAVSFIAPVGVVQGGMGMSFCGLRTDGYGQ